MLCRKLNPVNSGVYITCILLLLSCVSVFLSHTVICALLIEYLISDLCIFIESFVVPNFILYG